MDQKIVDLLKKSYEEAPAAVPSTREEAHSILRKMGNAPTGHLAADGLGALLLLELNDACRTAAHDRQFESAHDRISTIADAVCGIQHAFEEAREQEYEASGRKATDDAETEAEDAARQERINSIHAKVQAALGACGMLREEDEFFVYYAAYRTVDDLPVDNLDEVAVDGQVRFVMDADSFYGGSTSKAYRSAVVESPTWLQVCCMAEAMIYKTRDTHHVFLEGIDKCKLQPDEGVIYYEFAMGS